MKDLLTEWVQRPKQPSRVEGLSEQQTRISNEVRILEALEAAGCAQIPDEPVDVPSMIEIRYQVLEDLHGTIS